MLLHQSSALEMHFNVRAYWQAAVKK